MICFDAGGSVGYSTASLSWKESEYFLRLGQTYLKVVSSQPFNCVVRITMLSKDIIGPVNSFGCLLLLMNPFLQLAGLMPGVAKKIDCEGAKRGAPDNQYEYGK
jgi:hypothetical protein